MTLPSPVCMWRALTGLRSWLTAGYRTSGHLMVDTEIHGNVTVIVSKCVECGTQQIGWRR